MFFHFNWLNVFRRKRSTRKKFTKNELHVIIGDLLLKSVRFERENWDLKQVRLDNKQELEELREKLKESYKENKELRISLVKSKQSNRELTGKVARAEQALELRTEMFMEWRKDLEKDRVIRCGRPVKIEIETPECEICAREYSSDVAELCPKTLPCGHTLCQECVGNLAKNTHEIDCPFDRKRTQMHGTGLDMLPRNFAILDIVEQNKQKAKKI